MLDKCYYLAYGSNLHPLRLRERISSSAFVELIELPKHQLHFHKHCTVDGSGKCNLLFTDNTAHKAIGAVFEMSLEQKSILDTFEGEGYEVVSSQLKVANKLREVFWYQAIDDYIDKALTPYNWYHKIVMMGAEYHGFPEEYLRHLQSFSTMADPDSERHQNRFALIERMRGYSRN